MKNSKCENSKEKKGSQFYHNGLSVQYNTSSSSSAKQAHQEYDNSSMVKLRWSRHHVALVINSV